MEDTIRAAKHYILTDDEQDEVATRRCGLSEACFKCPLSVCAEDLIADGEARVHQRKLSVADLAVAVGLFDGGASQYKVGAALHVDHKLAGRLQHRMDGIRDALLAGEKRRGVA